MKGFIVDSSSTVINNETFVDIFGKLENGQSFIARTKIEPYFFIRTEDEKHISLLLKKFTVEHTTLVNFEGKKVTKISYPISAELNKLEHAIYHKIETYEADIKPNIRFAIDKDLLNTLDIEGDYQPSDRVDRVYINPEIKPASFFPKLKIASIDIEADNKTGDLICIGIVSENYEKNFMVTKNKLKNTISCSSEEDCLEKFRKEIIKLDPDIITGWNLIDFDLAYLKEKFTKHKIPFDIGRNEENTRLRLESEFFRASSAKIPGRQVLDALSLIRDPFIKEAPSIKYAEFESYKLEDVAQTILGESKFIKGKNRHEELDKLFRSKGEKEHQRIVDYNLTDCRLVFEILKKTKMIELSIERSGLTGLPLDRLTASIAAFDSLYIREARKKGLVSPTMIFKEKQERIKGGFVQMPEPGVYHNVLVLDFKSLYPSIIRTFNIDPASFLKKEENNIVKAPNGAIFKNSEGILPIIIEQLHHAREKAKKEERELSSYAIKIIMNSFFGVLASPNCRYFNLDIANAITYFGQMLIQLTAKEIEKKGYNVIYSDTDSVFVETRLKKEAANKLGKEIQVYINEFYQDYVKKNYNRKSFLELEFEKQYIFMLIPKLRGAEGAAKKRYAGLIEKNGKEEIEIIGLEAIRGDWTEAARDFQKELLYKLFHNEPIEQFIRAYIKKIREGKMDDKLVYKKSIRKSLEEYTKTTPPHVKAARQLEGLETTEISYYITTEGPEPIQKLKHKLDYDHYIDKQIKPIANQILLILNKTFDNILQKSKQQKLF